MTIAEALKRFRASNNLTQREVAEVLEIPQTSYARYEMGKFMPRADDLIKLAQAFGVSADYLLGLSDEPQPRPADVVLLERLKAMRAEIDALLERFQ